MQNNAGTPGYFLDQNEVGEMTRLLLQDRFFTETIQGGLLSERPTFEGIHRVLDVACGPGGWATAVAQANPGIKVRGLDISEPMINFARARAFQEGVRNIDFDILDATTYPLPYQDHSFDFINARLLYAFMKRDWWPLLVAECYRLTAPGGFLRICTEDAHFITNSNALTHYHSLGCLALYRAGNGFYEDNLGIIPRLRNWARDAGFEVHSQSHMVIDVSYGTEGHQIAYEDYKILLKALQPFLLRFGVGSQEELDEMYEQCVRDMESKDFAAWWHFSSIWAQKPAD
jgi:ubiquinone/menaquinone biosynthesis C-methylase UbiE